MREFDEIRPYNDCEVPEVIGRMIADNELIDLLLEDLFSGAGKLLYPWLRPLLRARLRYTSRKIVTVDMLQQHLATRLKTILDQTTDGYSFSGLSGIENDKSYVFMSNHRDIALDPAITVLGLVESGRDSLRIAIGDNLLSKPFASDLMRINRSFIVKRSVVARREKLKALKILSNYIRQSVCNEGISIWIAQAEGRAKDGKDRTETALLKMLALSRSKDQDFSSAINELNIVPVSISYEYDPCDADKARELYIAKTGNSYVKTAFEDLETIKKGFIGYKGRVHVHYGSPCKIANIGAENLAADIDDQIFCGYRLFPSNIVAWQMLYDSLDVTELKHCWPDEDWFVAHAKFEERIEALPEKHRDIVVQAYASPVTDQLSSSHHRA